MRLLESPHRGDSNEHTQHTIIAVKMKIPKIIQKSVCYGFFIFLLGLEIAVVNEPSVFKPLKFYCIYIYMTAAETHVCSLSVCYY